MQSFKKNAASFLAKLGHLWLDKVILRSLIISCFLIIVQISIIFIFLPKLPAKVPLFYSRPWGETQLASSQSLLLLPLISSLFLTINTVAASYLVDKKRFLSSCSVLTGLIISMLLLITLVEIIIVIG